MKLRFRFAGALAALLVGALGLSSPAVATATHPHYTANLTGQYSAALTAGYDWVDVSSKSVMDALPAGQKGVFWLGNGYNSACSFSQSDATISAKVTANVGDPKFSGVYYISDEPHTDLCSGAPQAIADRTTLIHSLDSNAKTFIVVLDGSNHPGEYQAFANSADYIGVDPYPCNVNNATSGCNYSSLTSKIDLALTYIPASRMVPVFQTFGQTCNSGSHYYRMPTPAEMSAMLAIWDTKVPPSGRPFDYSYSWGVQSSSCPTLNTQDGGVTAVMTSYFANMG